MNTTSRMCCAAVFGTALSFGALAKAPEEQVLRLGKDLTAIGAVREGGADGRIPAWTGGANFTDEQRRLTPKQIETMPPDELAKVFGGGRIEKPLFTITRENLAQYAPQLTAGHRKLFERLDGYKMPVYAGIRSGYFPPEIEAATIENSRRAELSGSEDVVGAVLGFPFPLPTRGEEIVWNHKMKFRGTAVRRYNNQAIVQPDGSYTLTKLIEDVKFKYANIQDRARADNKLLLMYLSEYLSPPRIVGQFILAHDPIQGVRSAWVYNPSIKRIRRLPDAGFDNPTEGSDNQQIYDQIDMFNGALLRYDWKLVGRAEMYIPYNSWAIADRRLKFADILKPRHINQELARYELHRVWIVEASLRPKTSHIFKTRRFYVDEDSWSIAAVDLYDNRDELWKFQEGHLGTYPMIPTVTAIPEVIYDLQSGGYFVTAMQNEDKVSDYLADFDDDYFTTQNVVKKTRR